MPFELAPIPLVLDSELALRLMIEGMSLLSAQIAAVSGPMHHCPGRESSSLAWYASVLTALSKRLVLHEGQRGSDGVDGAARGRRQLGDSGGEECAGH
eukprot:1223900-Rhodomonas_salina.1